MDKHSLSYIPFPSILSFLLLVELFTSITYLRVSLILVHLILFLFHIKHRDGKMKPYNKQWPKKKKYLIASGTFSASTRPFSNTEILFIIFNADLRFANREGFMHLPSLQWKKMRTVHIYTDRQVGNVI